LSPELTAALREQTPTASGELRERVALIAATPPPRRRTISLRRTLFLGAPAAAVASLVVAVVVGIITSSTPAPGPSASATTTVAPELYSARERVAAPDRNLAPSRAAAVPGPTLGRAQNVQTALRVLVDNPDELSTATQRALRTTRRLGGYVVTVSYGTPEPTEGAASLRLRVPVSRVQAAIVSFSHLGRILLQQTQITDLQQRLDELTRQLRRAKGDKAKIRALRRERIAINRRAAYATVDLGLTTHEPEAKTTPPGRLDRTIDDATGVLTAELAIGAYALIVASPFLVLLVAAYAGSRAYRRYADQRLLERA
jgi:Domain of unknown function (DUF4349)